MLQLNEQDLRLATNGLRIKTKFKYGLRVWLNIIKAVEHFFFQKCLIIGQIVIYYYDDYGQKGIIKFISFCYWFSYSHEN